MTTMTSSGVGHTCLLLIPLLATITADSMAARPCPAVCRCQTDVSSSDVIVSCQSSELAEVPAPLPTRMGTLDLSGNRLNSLSVTELTPNEAMTVILTFNVTRNAIGSIDSGAFRRVLSMESVDLSDNRLSTIDHGTFDGPSRSTIQNLDLSTNRLTDIDGAFSAMVNLSRLDLRNNFIAALSEFTFRDLTNLRYLFLTNNRIYNIDKRAFRALPHLLYLVLKGNPLHEFTRFHFHVPSSLSYVDISECGLVQLPAGLPTSLRYLQMRRNNVTTLTSGVFNDCPDVDIVVLDENQIQRIDGGSLSGLRRIKQLWLNDNQLVRLPRPLPASLRRLLVDNNHVTRIENDTFGVRSELTSLSLVGNRLEALSREAMQQAVNLQSIDLSNNLIQSLPVAVFAGNSKLRAIQLSKNPLEALDVSIFGGLSSLKVLSLSYIQTSDMDIPGELLRPLTALNRLDLDNSPTLVNGLMWSRQIDLLGSLEELGLVNCGLRSLPTSWPVLSRLNQLRLSTSRLHCDKSIAWLRDWLLNPENVKKLDGRPDEVRCGTPEDVRNRALVELTDSQLVAAVPDPPTTTLSQSSLPSSVASDHQPDEQTGTAVNVEDKTSSEAELEANDNDHLDRYIDLYPPDYAILPADPDPDELTDDYEDYNAIIASPSSTTTSSSSTASTSTASTSTTADRTLAAFLMTDSEVQDLQKFKFQMIIAGSTVGATIVVVTVIVAAIIYVCRHQKQTPSPSLTTPQPSGRTFIKYKNKSGVLYFSTPADPGESTPGGLEQTEIDQHVTISQFETTALGETKLLEAGGTLRHYVVPIAASTPETPQTPASYKTRVYRWEDF